MDTRWLLEWEGQRVLIDPWLADSDVDGAWRFNEQWHVRPPIPVAELRRHDAIVV